MLDDYQVIVKVKQQQYEDLIREQAQLRQIRQANGVKPANQRIMLAIGRWMAACGQRIQARYGEEAYPVPITGQRVYDC